MSASVSSAVNWLPRRAAIELNDRGELAEFVVGRDVDPGRKVAFARAARAVDELFERPQRAPDLRDAQQRDDQ